MEIIINGKPYIIQSGEIIDNKIICVVLQFIDEKYNDTAYFVARYSDPYCGNKSKSILDALNTEPYATQVKEFINSIPVE